MHSGKLSYLKATQRELDLIQYLGLPVKPRQRRLLVLRFKIKEL